MTTSQKPPFRAPRTPAERIKDAQQHIESLRSAMSGQHGEVYRNCMDAIKRWHAVIVRESKRS